MTEQYEDTKQFPYDREDENVRSDDPTEVIPPVQGFSPGADFSILDTFKQELQELTQAEDVLIPVKGYEASGLQIKYRMPATGQEIEKIGRGVQRRYKDIYDRNLNTAMEMMIYLCEGLYVQPEGVEEPVMLDPQETGEPCRFDERLAELVGMKPEDGMEASPKAVLRKLFGNNELAIISHAERLQRWLQNTKADLTSEIWQLGE